MRRVSLSLIPGAPGAGRGALSPLTGLQFEHFLSGSALTERPVAGAVLVTGNKAVNKEGHSPQKAYFLAGGRGAPQPTRTRQRGPSGDAGSAHALAAPQSAQEAAAPVVLVAPAESAVRGGGSDSVSRGRTQWGWSSAPVTGLGAPCSSHRVISPFSTAASPVSSDGVRAAGVMGSPDVERPSGGSPAAGGRCAVRAV